MIPPIEPWKTSPDLSKRVQDKESYSKVKLLPSDPEWCNIQELFHVNPPVGYSIEKVYLISNRSSVGKFEKKVENLETESDDCSPDWQNASNLKLRKKWMERYQTLTASQNQRVKVIPLWYYSTTAEKCRSICQNGFAVDKGGDCVNGTYFSTSAHFAAKFHCYGNLFLGYVAIKQPFPITHNDNYKSMTFNNYDALYIPVTFNNSSTENRKYAPCLDPTIQKPQCDVVVMLQPDQTLVRFLLKIKANLPKNPSDIFAKASSLVEALNNQSKSQTLTDEEQQLLHELGKFLAGTEKVNHLATKQQIQPAPVQIQPAPVLDSKTIELKNLIQQINSKEITFQSLNLQNIDEIQKYFGNLSHELTTLELNSLSSFTKEDSEKIKRFFPNLNHFALHVTRPPRRMGEAAFDPLKDLPLTSLDFSNCTSLEDRHLTPFKGKSSLTSINLHNCTKLTDNAIAIFAGMPLRRINCGLNYNITDKAFAIFKPMPLENVSFTCCKLLTKEALSSLKGKPSLKTIDFSNCDNIKHNDLDVLTKEIANRK